MSSLKYPEVAYNAVLTSNKNFIDPNYEPTRKRLVTAKVFK